MQILGIQGHQKLCPTKMGGKGSLVDTLRPLECGHTTRMRCLRTEENVMREQFGHADKSTSVQTSQGLELQF